MNPSVFGDLSQDDLDRAYDQDVWAPDAAAIQSRIFAASVEVARQTPPQTRRYGSGEKQLIDIFAGGGVRDAPVMILIHGGAWRIAMREAFYGPAPAVMSAGCILAVVGFECLPAITMAEMAAQIRDAIGWIAREIGGFGGDCRKLNLIGHSSGAHMAAVMLTSDWTGRGLDPTWLRGATLLSGLYELHPAMLSARGRYMGLSADDVTALSPLRHLHRFAGRAMIAWGTGESPEFIRQSRVFADALGGMGRLARAMPLSGVNHFQILEALNDADHTLTRAMLDDARR